MPDESPEELNADVFMDIDAQLSTNGGKRSDAEILAEIQEEIVQEEESDDISAVYDKPQEPTSALEVNRAIEVLQQLTQVFDERGKLREVLMKVNRYLLRAIVKPKKQATLNNWFNF